MSEENRSGTPLLGHLTQRNRLVALAGAGRLPSTLLLAGPASIGKYAVAQELAKSILCAARSSEGHPCGRCEACTLLATGSHPDLHLIDFAESATTDIDSTREELSRLALRAFLGGARVCIIRDAEGMSPQIANLLLKTLEEPRPDTHFILTSSSPSRLPPTVCSRAQVWFFDRLSDADLSAIVEGLASGGGRSGVPLELLEGTLEHVNLLISEDASEHVQLWGEVRDALDRCVAGETSAGLALVSKLGKDKERVLAVMDLMRLHCRRRMRECAATHAGDVAGERRPEARRWAIALSELVYARALISDRNLSPQSVLLYWILLLSPDATPNSFTAREHSGSLLSESIF